MILVTEMVTDLDISMGSLNLKNNQHLGGIEFVDDFSDFNEALKLAEDVGGNDLALSVVNQNKSFLG